MPPRLQFPVRTSCIVSKSLGPNSIAPFLLPFLHPQLPSCSQPSQRLRNNRNASVLSNLTSPSGAYSKKIRRGRGPASGKGKTSGRGHKGQKQHGKVPRGFTGGQTKEEVVKGKRGFKNVFAAELSPLNLDRLQTWIDEGRLDTSKPITLKELNDSRCLHGVKADGVKLLARDAHKLTHPINIVVSRASASAIDAVERAGGQVMTRYYTWQSIRRILRGQSHPTGPLENFPINPPLASGRYEYTLGYRYRLPNPASRKAIEYYRDPAHRGYLAHTLAEGEGPSLFFKTAVVQAREREKRLEAKKAKGLGQTAKDGKKREEGRLW
ncbi:ribosomal protein L15 [Viridothelium virens]|uniref:Ribosomal protein L15 n=1 Tax=Viridothelium virens TaxID=1048519 RepID=A0A6A6H5X6_VIRVR|nr:ribosomal protein L15 [Viridothelium virens]